MLNADIDEYGFPIDMDLSSPLLKYLKGISATIEVIQLNSMPFGNGKGNKNTTLVIDHDFRKKQDLKDAKFSRQKIFLNAAAAPSLHFHEISGAIKAIFAFISLA